MAIVYNTSIVISGLAMYLDAANSKSYPGSGTAWTDISGNGNNTTLINGPTYNSANNGALVFDGVDDYARPTVTHSYLNSSALEVIFNSTNHGTGYKTIFGYRHNGGYSLPTIGSIFLNGSTLSASVITASQVYRTATFGTNISTNTVYHVVLNKNTVSGSLQFFVNGVAGTAESFDAATYAQWPTAGSYIGANELDIAKSTNTNAGQGWSADYFAGRIYKLAVYNRILTQAEIQQNFDAMRGRYGI